ncbi:MAG TPA: metalloregulator ArsR/SmtB family transcription factor [Acidimicrobiales bacterium]|nr:metalloregulator ArsR/SmtB family transcription factor [Acidimicrobiales bacterium]
MTGDALDAVFSALADPTRRGLVSRLVREGPHTATDLARDLPMTRQAVVHHLQALGEAGLVDAHRDGREVRYRATPEPLGDAVTWMLDSGAKWDRRLQRLRAQVEARGPTS